MSARKVATPPVPADATPPADAAPPVSAPIVKLAKARKPSAEPAFLPKSGVIYNLPPAGFVVEEGYNVRTFDPSNPRHVALASSIRMMGVQTPITFRMVDGKPVIVAGHLRHGACNWLASLPGKDKHVVPSIPSMLRDDMANDRLRTGDLAVSNSAVQLTPMEQAQTAERMVKSGIARKAVAAHLGCSEKWVGELLKLETVRGTALANMAESGGIGATLAAELIGEHGAERAAELAGAVFASLEAKAKYGDKPRVSRKHIDAYLASLAKMPADKPASTTPASTTPASTTPADPLVKLATTVTEAEARLKSAKGNSRNAAKARLAEARAVLAEARAAALAESKATEPVKATEPAPQSKQGQDVRPGGAVTGALPNADDYRLHQNGDITRIVNRSGVVMCAGSSKAFMERLFKLHMSNPM